MIIMHHLRAGRAIFTTAFLEELGVDYELRLYDRDQFRRAPRELRDAHALGKSPVIEDKGRTLAESGAITAYLIDTYDTAHQFAPSRDETDAWLKFSQWLHYAEGSATTPLLLNLMLNVEQVTAPVIQAFTEGETKLHLGYLNAALDEQDYIMGDTFSAADVGCGYVAAGAGRLKLLDNYPNIAAYAERLTQRPAFRRAYAKTGG